MNNSNIEGNYQFKIYKSDDFYIAEIKMPNGEGITQGKNEQEIFEMIADCLMASYEIKYPLWKKILIKIFKL